MSEKAENTVDIKSYSIEKLIESLFSEKKDLFTLRLQKSVGGLKQTHLLKKKRKQVARIKAAISLKEKQSKE